MRKLRTSVVSGLLKHSDMERFGGWLKCCLSFIVERDRLPFWVDYIEQQDTIHSKMSWMQEKRQFMNYNLFKPLL